MTPGAPKAKVASFPGPNSSLLETCLSNPTLWQSAVDFGPAFNAKPAWMATSAQPEALARVSGASSFRPLYLSGLFRATRDPSSPYLLKTRVTPALPISQDLLYGEHDVEARRYPLIHELTGHLRRSQSLFSSLKAKEEELVKEVLKFQQLLKSQGSLTPLNQAQELERTKQRLTRDLQAIREMLKELEAPIQGLEQWALNGGKDKAVTREAGLDMVFQLYRANEAVTRGETGERMHSALDFLRETQGRRLRGTGPEGRLGFGLAVLDFNITGPNTLDRDLGDLVLDETFQTLRKQFPKEHGSTVSLGTRTNFRLINPDTALLDQKSILKLEEEIESNIRKRVEADGKPSWKKFVEDYRAGVSVGYAEVEFRPGEIQFGRGGEYAPESVTEQLGRLDHGFRLAHARSQEITARLKEEKSLQDLSKAERLHYGQMPISDLNGIPEGRYVEPGEVSSGNLAAPRLVHSIQGMKEKLKSVQNHLNSLDLFLLDPVRHADKVQDVLVGAHNAQKIFNETGDTYYSLAYDASHDLRMPRLVERSYAAERIDSVVRESGGAKMLFVEMGKFKGFITGWYGGSEDKYVHDLIYEFNKVVVKHGLVQIHPGNRAPLLDENGHLAVDPKTGQYFKFNESTSESSSSGLRLLRDPQLSVPVGSEVTLAIREGDEIGFIIGERRLDGQPVTQEEISAVFQEFNEVLQNKFGQMHFDDIEKVKPNNIRLPKWELHEWKEGKEAGHALTRSEILVTEHDALAGYTGWVVDYEGLKESDLRPSVVKGHPDSSEKTVARRQRWRYFQEGAPTNKVFQGKLVELSSINAKPEAPTFPDRLKVDAPELLREPILARVQTQLSAGYVVIDLSSGAQLEKAWATVNDAAKTSKAQGGKPIFLPEPQTLGSRPPGHRYDSSISTPRSREIAAYFDEYSRGVDPPIGKAMSVELAEFIGKHGAEIGRRSEVLSKESFAKQVKRSILANVKEGEPREKLLVEVAEHFEKGGSLARVRDGLMAAQVLQKEGLSLHYESLGPSLWTALDLAEKSLEGGKTQKMLGEAKARFVKLYIQQTGTPPPEAILAEGRKFLDPHSIFIPQEIFSLARRYKVPPERVPYFVAGMKADEIRKTGQEAFRGLTYEDLRNLADSPEGQAFLKDPKNSLLLQDTLKSRSLTQGVPLLTSMLTIFPAEMLCGYLAKKIGSARGLSQSSVEELKFGMTLYFLHGINLTTTGAWEVAVQHGLANRVFTGTKSLGALNSKVFGGILQPGKLAGQEVVEVGLKTGDSLGRAVWHGILEKWGVLEGEKVVWKTMGRHMLLGVPKVPLNLLRTMGAGYLSSAIFDKAAGQIWSPDHPMRKYGSFVAFFAPDLLRLGLGSSRIAASPFLSRGGAWFSRAGTGLLAVSLANYGMRRLVVGDDYNAWVNQRIGDKVYGENVEKLEKTDWFVLPLLVKGVRWGARKLAPDMINWSLAVDNSDLKNQILSEDLDRSRKVYAGFESLFPRMLADPNFYDLKSTQSYMQIDFTEFTQPVTLSAQEEEMLQKLEKAGDQPVEQVLGDLSLYQRNEFLRRVQVQQIQQSARYLVQVGLSENDWAREIFAADGTLKPGMGTKLLERIHPSKAGEPGPTDKVLTSRQVMVGLALLDGKKEFLGRNTMELARVAGIVDDKNKYVLSPAHYAALTLYGQQLRESVDPAAAERLTDLSAKLQSAYLKAEPLERPKLMEALRCLGETP